MMTASQVISSFQPSTTCPRCQGFRMPQAYCDVQDTSDPAWVFSLRCLNCGAIEDPLIVKNRHLPHRSLPLHRKLPQTRGIVRNVSKDSCQKREGKRH
jgi:hypothetical protein